MFQKNTPVKILSLPEARKKIERYCAYQERCQQEVRDKLYSYGLHQADVENTISDLIQDNFINEERFALAYAQGKFRMKRWGRNKIRFALKRKQISPKLVTKALKCIDLNEYFSTLEKLVKAKKSTIGSSDRHTSDQKIISYALGKGFEYDLIREVLENL